jgi:hypothetical protein
MINFHLYHRLNRYKLEKTVNFVFLNNTHIPYPSRGEWHRRIYGEYFEVHHYVICSHIVHVWPAMHCNAICGQDNMAIERREPTTNHR